MALTTLAAGKDLFDTDLFIDRAELVKYNLVCPICTYAAEEIVDTPCGHLFCRQCIVTASSFKSECPVCRKPLRASELHASAYLQRMVDDMRVRCVHRDCKEWQGRRGDLARHLLECGHVMIPCRLCRQKQKRSLLTEHETRLCHRRLLSCDHCHMSMTSDSMVEHRQQCAALPIPCPNDCNTVTLLPRGQLAHHLANQCPLAESPCPFSRWGCEFGGKKGTLPLHLTDTAVMAAHLSLLERQCVRTDVALTDAEARERRRDDIIQQQQSAIHILQQQVAQLLALQAASISSPVVSTPSSSHRSVNGLHLVTSSTSSSAASAPSSSSTPLARVVPNSAPTMTPARSVSTGAISSHHTNTNSNNNNANNNSGANTVTYVTQLQSPSSERKVIETPKRSVASSTISVTPSHAAHAPHTGNSVYMMTPHHSRPPPVSTRVERKSHHLRLQVGLFFDIQDAYGKWLEAEIIQVNDNKCLVHYLKWDSKWDEWFIPDDEPYRVADFHQFSSGDTTGRYVLGQRVLIYPPKPPSSWYEGEVAKIDGQNVLVLYKAKELRWWFHAESDCIVALDS